MPTPAQLAAATDAVLARLWDEPEWEAMRPVAEGVARAALTAAAPQAKAAPAPSLAASDPSLPGAPPVSVETVHLPTVPSLTPDEPLIAAGVTGDTHLDLVIVCDGCGGRASIPGYVPTGVRPSVALAEAVTQAGYAATEDGGHLCPTCRG